MIDSYSNTFHSQKIHQTLSKVCAVRGMEHVVTAMFQSAVWVSQLVTGVTAALLRG